MGNGVTRVLSVAEVPEIPPAEFFEMFRPARVTFPLMGRVEDALACAVGSLGLDVSREYVGGYMRALTDDITEFCVW